MILWRAARRTHRVGHGLYDALEHLGISHGGLQVLTPTWVRVGSRMETPRCVTRKSLTLSGTTLTRAAASAGFPISALLIFMDLLESHAQGFAERTLCDADPLAEQPDAVADTSIQMIRASVHDAALQVPLAASGKG